MLSFFRFRRGRGPADLALGMAGVRLGERLLQVGPSDPAVFSKAAAKAGLTLQQVMQECCARGWRGFKAEWLQGRQSSAQRVQVGQPQSFAQQDREAGWARWEEMTGRVHPDRAAAQQIRPVQDFVIDASAGLVAGGAVFPALEG